jgi:hypothetical protein
MAMTVAALHAVPLKKCLHVFVADKLASARLRPALPDCSERFLVELDRRTLRGLKGSIGHFRHCFRVSVEVALTARKVGSYAS